MTTDRIVSQRNINIIHYITCVPESRLSSPCKRRTKMPVVEGNIQTKNVNELQTFLMFKTDSIYQIAFVIQSHVLIVQKTM